MSPDDARPHRPRTAPSPRPRSACSNWGRWGPDDVRGTMNFLDDAKRREAAALVVDGRSFSLSQRVRHGRPAARLAAAHQPGPHDARHRDRCRHG